jgi:hypothetical protein
MTLYRDWKILGRGLMAGFEGLIGLMVIVLTTAFSWYLHCRINVRACH